MSSVPYRHRLGAAVVLAFGGATFAAAAAPTLKDLQKRQIELRTDRKVDTSAAKAMESYRRFLDLRNADPAQRAQALRRLGDLSLESGEMERMESEVSRVDLGGAEAIRLYTTLLKAHPDYDRNDQVLYQLARAYETTGQPDRALATLDESVARYPGSAQSDEVQFRRGELLFSSQRYREAERAYAIVVGYGRGGAFYQQSLYKQGWAMFKQSLDDESLPVFARLLELKLIRPDGGAARLEDLPRADRELVDDTLRVTSVIFFNQEGTAPLDGFVTRQGNPSFASLLYSRLGDLYVEKQRYQDAAAVYRAFVARSPNSEFAPGLSSQAIEAYRKGGFAQLVLDGKREYVERYNFDSEFWRSRERAQYAQVVTELKTNLTDVAAYYHATAQKSRRPADFSEAAHWYGVQLQSFPDDPDAARTNYLMADALFEGGRFGEAVEAYEKAAYGYPAGENSAKAGYAALSAYQKQEPLLPPGERAAWTRRAIDSGIRFAMQFPAHPDAVGVLTRATQDLYTAGDLPAAIGAAERVLAHQPPADADKRRIAFGVMGQSRFDLRDFAGAETAWLSARELAAGNMPLRKSLDEQLAVSVYRQAEVRRANGDAAGAVEDFLRIASVSPASPIRATAQYDAAAALIGLKDWPRAIDVLETWRRENPKSELAGDATQKLAVAYTEAGRPVQAATEFERIADDRSQPAAVREEALVLAAVQRGKAGDRARTVAVLERLIAEYPRSVAERIENRGSLAALAAAAGDRGRERYWQREIVKADAAAGAARTDRTRYLAAKASLVIAQPARDAFRDVKLVSPLKRTLAAKRKSLEAALAAYRESASYDIAEVTTQASFEMADLYARLGADLMASERPKNLKGDELEQYDLLLEEQAIPFEEQAIKLHEANARRAVDGLYDDGVRASYGALAKLLPARYGKTERFPDYVVPATGASADFTAAIAAARAGQLAEAETRFALLQGADPGWPAPAFNRALVLLAADRRDEAAGVAQLAADRSPQDAAAHDLLGLALRAQGRFADAAAAYERAIAVNPDYPGAHRNLAVLRDLYLGDPGAALPALERYQVLTGEDRPVNGWLADLRQRSGRTAPSQPDASAAPAAAPEEVP